MRKIPIVYGRRQYTKIIITIITIVTHALLFIIYNLFWSFSFNVMCIETYFFFSFLLLVIYVLF